MRQGQMAMGVGEWRERARVMRGGQMLMRKVVHKVVRSAWCIWQQSAAWAMAMHDASADAQELWIMDRKMYLFSVLSKYRMKCRHSRACLVLADSSYASRQQVGAFWTWRGVAPAVLIHEVTRRRGLVRMTAMARAWRGWCNMARQMVAVKCDAFSLSLLQNTFVDFTIAAAWHRWRRVVLFMKTSFSKYPACVQHQADIQVAMRFWEREGLQSALVALCHFATSRHWLVAVCQTITLRQQSVAVEGAFIELQNWSEKRKWLQCVGRAKHIQVMQRALDVLQNNRMQRKWLHKQPMEDFL